MDSRHNFSAEQAFNQLESRPDGLTEAEAADRFTRFGSNLLKTRQTGLSNQIIRQAICQLFHHSPPSCCWARLLGQLHAWSGRASDNFVFHPRDYLSLRFA